MPHPALDTRYIESVPHVGVFRASVSPAVAPTGWAVLPFASASQVLSVMAGILVLGDGGRLFVGSSLSSLQGVELKPPQLWLHGATLAARDIDANTTLVAGVDASGSTAAMLSCTFPLSSSPHPICAQLTSSIAIPSVGRPRSVAFAPLPSGSLQLWIGGDGGLVSVPSLTSTRTPDGSPTLFPSSLGEEQRSASYQHALSNAHRIFSHPVAALAARESNPPQVAVGSSERLWIFSPADAPLNATLIRSEWATDPVSKKGGAVDDAIAALAYETRSGILFIGTASALNIRALDGTIGRRVGADGLPCANMSSLSITAHPLAMASDADQPKGAPHAQLWIGCDRGVALVDIDRTGQPAHHSFRYLNGPRWHSGARVTDMATVTSTSAVPAVSVLTDGGVTILHQELWTLTEKAAHYERILTRHHRHHMASDCQLASFGSLESCRMGAGDNDGLFTAIPAVAEALRYGATGDPAAKALAFGFFEGLETLYNVTGKAGLVARCAIAPGDPRGGGTSSSPWHNSSAPGYAGWVFKGDASSDEVTGHMFGYQSVRQIATERGSAERARVERCQLDLARNLVWNGFKLIDVTMKPTTWGHWDASTLNDDRDWSDGRGINSMQILAFLASANATATEIGDMATVKLLTDGYAQLAHIADYASNVLNAKIVSQCDDNFSDDELLMLPVYTHLAASPPNAFTDRLKAGLRRSWDVALAEERSAAWGAIFLAAGGARSEAEHASVLADVLWSLRNWPLDMRTWPVTNSHRLDLVYRRGADRFGVVHNRVYRVLPANERRQHRWNTDPFDVSDGGDGMGESTPDTWLLPYWMARYHGLLAG